jgi:hypothetical protein
VPDHPFLLGDYLYTALLNPSTCVDNYETSYFLTGALPPPGTVYRQDQQPFGLAGGL